MHAAVLCGLAYKNGKEVLLLCKPGAGMSCEELPPVGTGSVGSWGLVNMSGDSASSHLKIFVIEGGDSGNHDVMLYESRTRAWRLLCKLPAAILSYASSLHRFPSVVIGHFLYILVALEGVALQKNYKIAALDFHRNEWAEFDVITPRAFSRIRLVALQERLMLVGVQEGITNVDDSYFVMSINFLSTTSPECVEISEMPGGFCAALASSNSVLKFKSVVCGYKNSIFFMSSRGKPVVYSTTKNAWSYVPDFNKKHLVYQGVDNFVALEKPADHFRANSVSGFEHRERPSVVGRPPRWRKSPKTSLSNG